MTLQEAIASGKKYKNNDHTSYFIFKETDLVSVYDFIRHDWELEPEPKEEKQLSTYETILEIEKTLESMIKDLKAIAKKIS